MSRAWRLYDRVRLPDGREGILHGQMWRGADPAEAMVLTDDYVEVTCLQSQLASARRHGRTVRYTDGTNVAWVYRVEVDNLRRLQLGTAHEGFAEHGCPDWPDYEPARLWRLGQREHAPPREDIRASGRRAAAPDPEPDDPPIAFQRWDETEDGIRVRDMGSVPNSWFRLDPQVRLDPRFWRAVREFLTGQGYGERVPRWAVKAAIAQVDALMAKAPPRFSTLLGTRRKHP